MSTLWLEHPEWLPAAIWIIGVASGALALSFARAEMRRRRIFGSLRAGRAEAGLRDAALLVALVAIAVALLGPRIAERTVWIHSAGADIVVLLDLSRSMDARDVAPSRLARAKRAILRLFEQLGADDHVALAAFSGRGVLLTPLTPDLDAVTEWLQALDTSLIDPPGSDLAGGLRAAFAAFDLASDRPRALLVASDGESSTDLNRSIASLRRAHVRVSAIALGSEAGAGIPFRGTPLLDRYGRPVTSRRDLASLRRLADRSGGALFAADQFGEVDSRAVAAILRSEVTHSSGEPRPVRRVEPLVWPLAGAAYALLCLDWLLPLRRNPRLAKARRPLGRALRAAAVVTALTVPGAPVLHAQAREAPRSAREQLADALGRAERGDRAGARRSFRAAAVLANDPELAALALYDLGVLEGYAGAFSQARDLFLDSLALRPDDLAAQRNAEWAAHRLAQQRAASKPHPPRAPPSPTDIDSSMEGTARKLEAETQQRWLHRVDDDAGRALRAAVQNPADAETPTGHQTW